MFIRDRGHGFGSRIKGFRRFGGIWKQKKHSLNTPVVITNEYHTSQICIFCYGFLQHPLKKVQDKDGNDKMVSFNDSFLCENPNCIPYLTGTASHGRDQLSSLSIGLSGLSATLFGIQVPCDKYNIRQADTDTFLTNTAVLSGQETSAGSAVDGSDTPL
ncbi:hypothetical protein K501DRAFT_192787 [Backusella circina FSU 941]|nr:hypothetical protein K501DRAFT_192787 [Backusella circina FSU 941]